VVLQIIAESKEPNTGSDSLKQKRNFFFLQNQRRNCYWFQLFQKPERTDGFHESTNKEQRTKSSKVTYPPKKKRAPTSIKALHKSVQNFVCLLLTYLAYMWMMISSSSSQIQDHPSKLCQVQQHNHQPACAADELY